MWGVLSCRAECMQIRLLAGPWCFSECNDWKQPAADNPQHLRVFWVKVRIDKKVMAHLGPTFNWKETTLRLSGVQVHRNTASASMLAPLAVPFNRLKSTPSFFSNLKVAGPNRNKFYKATFFTHHIKDASFLVFRTWLIKTPDVWLFLTTNFQTLLRISTFTDLIRIFRFRNRCCTVRYWIRGLNQRHRRQRRQNGKTQ